MSIKIKTADARSSPYKDLRATLIYCDPPTNRRHDQLDNNDRIPDDLYAQFAMEWLQDVVPKLQNPGRLALCINPRKRRLYEHLITNNHSHLQFEQEIILHYTFGHYIKDRFPHSHETILIFRLGHPPFHYKDILIESQRLKSGDHRADLRGRVPGDVWTMPRSTHYETDRKYFMETSERSVHPLEFCKRLVNAYTAPNQTVYDPFSGFGTMAVACKHLKRKYFGHDICEQYVKESKERIEKRDWLRWLKGI